MRTPAELRAESREAWREHIKTAAAAVRTPKYSETRIIGGKPHQKDALGYWRPL